MREVTAASLVIARPGRPLRAGTPSNRRVQFVVTDQELTAMKSVASTERRPLAAIVRDAVNEYVADSGERRVFRSGPFE
jgi:hypothetical protein